MKEVPWPQHEKTAKFLCNYKVELRAFVVRVLTVHPCNA